MWFGCTILLSHHFILHYSSLLVVHWADVGGRMKCGQRHHFVIHQISITWQEVRLNSYQMIECNAVSFGYVNRTVFGWKAISNMTRDTRHADFLWWPIKFYDYSILLPICERYTINWDTNRIDWDNTEAHFAAYLPMNCMKILWCVDYFQIREKWERVPENIKSRQCFFNSCFRLNITQRCSINLWFDWIINANVDWMIVKRIPNGIFCSFAQILKDC